jgi:hypothetical protein
MYGRINKKWEKEKVLFDEEDLVNTDEFFRQWVHFEPLVYEAL